MQIRFAEHASEDDIERYSLGRLDPDETERLEVHLLVCEHCQDRVAEADDFIRATRLALSEMQPALASLAGKCLARARFWRRPRPAR